MTNQKFKIIVTVMLNLLCSSVALCKGEFQHLNKILKLVQDDKKIIYIILFVTLNFLLLAFNLQPAAADMSSTNYDIKMNNVNIGSEKQFSDTYELSTTIGQTAAGEYSSTGYIIKAGFQYHNSIIPFSFSISDTSINFGTLNAQDPQTETADLTVSFGGASLYSVTAQEIGKLSMTDGSNEIEDTSCNGGPETCNENSAAVWDSTSAYGFGYNISGDDHPSDFTDLTYFRRFPDSTTPEAPVEIMANNNVTIDPGSTPVNTRKSTVTFKVNIAGNQPAGNYITVIRFTATPSY